MADAAFLDVQPGAGVEWTPDGTEKTITIADFVSA